jgi:hypothetical protein
MRRRADAQVRGRAGLMIGLLADENAASGGRRSTDLVLFPDIWKAVRVDQLG